MGTLPKMLRIRRKLRRGFTLVETLISCALLVIIGIVIVILYQAAYVEFEATAGTVNMNQSARFLNDKVEPMVSTAEFVSGVGIGAAFIHPNAGDFNINTSEVPILDFLSNTNYLPQTTLNSYPKGVPASMSTNNVGGVNFQWWMDPYWVTNKYVVTPQALAAQGMVGIPIYENDDPAIGQPLRRYPSIYRYRIIWNDGGPTAKAVDGSSRWNTGALPGDVMLQRLQARYEVNDVTQDIYGGTPYAPAIPCQRLAHNVAYLGFSLLDSSIQMHVKVYNSDATTARQIVGFSGKQSGSPSSGGQGRHMLQAYDYYTILQIPNYTTSSN